MAAGVSARVSALDAYLCRGVEEGLQGDVMRFNHLWYYSGLSEKEGGIFVHHHYHHHLEVEGIQSGSCCVTEDQCG